MATIYLDHCATTPVRREVAELVNHAMITEFGNPSSLHPLGLQAEELLKKARRRVAAALAVSAAEIYFTAGGTEANNLALRGAAVALQRRGCHIITSAVEHPSVLTTCRDLAEAGFNLTVLPVDQYGRVSPEAVAQALRADTVLVSIMLVNNELGTIQPLAAIGALLTAHRDRVSQPLLHVDAVQALGKMPVRPEELGADLLTLSSHKICGPKGVGALYVRRGVRLVPLLAGGEQEGGLRPGTENVPGIVGFGLAAELAEQERPRQTARLHELHQHLVTSLAHRLPMAHINNPPLGGGRTAAATNGPAGVSEGGPAGVNADRPTGVSTGNHGPTAAPAHGVPHVVNVGFPGLQAETLVHALAEADIYVSTGSACHSRRARVSHVLNAIGLPEAVARGSVRISMGPDTTRPDIDRLVDNLAQLVPDLLALARRR